jgi:hypothetical protein
MMTSKSIVLVALAAAAVGFAGRLEATRAETTRTVYVSAADAKGASVTDLTATDLVVKEDGKERAISSLQAATMPMDVVILVDDNGSGSYQPAVLQFLQTLMGHAKFSISQFSPQAVKILDTSDNFEAIQGALNRLGRRGKVDGSGDQLTEAIIDAANELHDRKVARPVILALTISGDSQTRNPDIAMKTLQATGAMLNVVIVAGAPAGQVLGDGPRQSGGRVEQIGALSGVPPVITKITDTLMHQYRLTYTLPDGVKPSDRLSVSTTRKGVSLVAPSRIPDK